MTKPELPRLRHVKSKKWFRRRNKWLFKSVPAYVSKWWDVPGGFPKPLDAKKLEYLCDADRATWEDRQLLLPDRWIYKLEDVIRASEGEVAAK